VEFQSIVPADGSGLVGETVPMQSLEKPIAATITSEQPTSSVPTVSPGRQTDNNQAGAGIAKGWEWVSPIFFSPVSLDPFLRHAFTPLDKARAFATFDDSFLQDFEFISF